MDDSDRVLQEALGIDPRSPMVFSAHGAALLMTGEYAAAQKAYEEALAVAPPEYAAFVAVGLAAARGGQGDRHRARSALESCAHDPRAKTPWLLPQLVLLHVHAGEKQTAIRLLRDEPFFSSYSCLQSIKGYGALRDELSFQHLLRDRYHEWELDLQRAGELGELAGIPPVTVPAPHA
jgi:tetratricopeptide (TPR) repeat protein